MRVAAGDESECIIISKVKPLFVAEGCTGGMIQNLHLLDFISFFKFLRTQRGCFSLSGVVALSDPRGSAADPSELALGASGGFALCDGVTSLTFVL